jgi:sarcosine oxidase subunit beta
MTGLFRHRTFLERHELKPSYDVVIVGGGVNGLSLAHNLATRHGITNVAVLDASYVGSGGSGRNTQVVRANYNTPETVPLYKASLGIWRTLSQELDFNLLFSTQGELDLCHTWDSLEVERDKSLLNRAYGVETDVVPRRDREDEPAGRPDWRR